MAEKKSFNLAAALGAVPDLGTISTGREQIEYIDIDRIDDDPNNFYELSGLDELAANIELCGLQQPIRVRAVEGGRFVIVSGHRRRAAIRKLVEDGRSDLRELPCIRERTDGSDALQELRLIYANSDTRKLTSAELSKQAERVEALLYQLKEEGYEFPGRMRDHVAEACKLSKSKLSRLKVIRDNLICDWYTHYASNELAESTAYTIAQMPTAHQMALYESTAQKGKNLRYFYESEAKRYGEKMEKAEGKQCQKRSDSLCDNVSNKLKRICNRQDDYMLTTPCAGCCAKCEYIASCSYACDLCRDEKQAAKDEKKAAKAAEKEAEERRKAEVAERDKDIISMIRRIRDIYSEKKLERGFEDDAYCAETGIHAYRINFTDEQDLSKYSSTPLGIDGDDAQHICAAADFLGVSVDYLLGRTDNPKGIEVVPAKAEENSCTLCKAAHPGCDECCEACDDHCNAWQGCRRENAVIPATQTTESGAAWYPTSVEPEIGQEIIAVDATGYAEDTRYIFGGLLSGGGMRWDEVTLWTPFPTAASVDPEDDDGTH